MTVAVTPVAGASYKSGNKTVRVVDVAASSTYPDGGEPLVASTTNVGLKKIEQFIAHGPALSTDRETANPVSYDYTNGTVIYMEGAASGAAIGEKTDSEAHATGSTFRATIVGW